MTPKKDSLVGKAKSGRLNLEEDASLFVVGVGFIGIASLFVVGATETMLK